MTAFDKAWGVVKADKPPTESHHPPHPTTPYIVTHDGKVDHICTDCGQESAVLIRESMEDGGHLTAGCDSCGYGGGSEMVEELVGNDPLTGKPVWETKYGSFDADMAQAENENR
jgi:predicted RNA-binding Zn-ribbon protein involved in translation (DUF1610 family)